MVRSGCLQRKTCPPTGFSNACRLTPIEARLAVVRSSSKGKLAASGPVPGDVAGDGHDLSDIKLASGLEDRNSFRQFRGLSRSEPTPERTTFVRFRKELVNHGLDSMTFEEIVAPMTRR